MKVKNLGNKYRISSIILAGLFFGLLLGCSEVESPQASQKKTGKTHQTIPQYRVETWQLKKIANNFWKPLDYTAELQTSVADQIKMVTWTIEGDVKKYAFWLDCNRPMQEVRHRVLKPGVTIENTDGPYEHTPTEYTSYHELIINSEGCGFYLPPASTEADPSLIRKNLRLLFKAAQSVRKERKLSFFDGDGSEIAQFEIMTDP